MQPNHLYQQYSEKIHAYLMRFVNETDAQDLTQEVFIKVSKNIDKFRGDSSIKTWIYRIATNTAKDFLKSRAYQASIKQTSISEKELEKYDASFGPDESIEEKIDASEMNKCILEFIHRLPINYSSILVLSELEGFNGEEIANIMNISIGAVKVRLHRARSRLKIELEGGCIISTNGNSKMQCERKKSLNKTSKLL